jgi:hypothetical protein
MGVSNEKRCKTIVDCIICTKIRKCPEMPLKL